MERDVMRPRAHRSFPALFFAAFLLALAARAQEPGDAAAEEPGAASCVGKVRLRGSFQRGAAEFQPGAAVVLDLIAQAIQKSCGGKAIIIEGHTDLLGDPASNQRLSERRAEEVKHYLEARGVPPEQLGTIGFGESRPLTTDLSEAAQALNRRVTFRLLEP